MEIKIIAWNQGWCIHTRVQIFNVNLTWIYGYCSQTTAHQQQLLARPAASTILIIMPPVSHVSYYSNQPALLMFMTAWFFFQVIQSRGEVFCVVTWISFNMVKQYGILHTYVWDNLFITCKRSMTLWSVHCRMFKSTRTSTEVQENGTMLFIVAMWHSYTRTILMQHWLIIRWMMLLLCDKQQPYFVLLILTNSEHKLCESVQWSILAVTTLQAALEGLISISTMTSMCKV